MPSIIPGARTPVVSAPQLGRPSATLGTPADTADTSTLINELNAKWPQIQKNGLSKAEGAWLVQLANHQNASEPVWAAIVAKLETSRPTAAAAPHITAVRETLKARISGASGFTPTGPTTPTTPGGALDPAASGGSQVGVHGIDYDRKRPASNYTVNFDAANATFNRGANKATKTEDLFTTLVPNPAGGAPMAVPTHYEPGKEIKLIAYDNAWGTNQKDIARFLAPGEVMIAVKHHKPKHAVLGGAGKEEVKLDATHIELAVGVMTTNADGKKEAGAITLNNPQNYEQGLFGEADYPMIFLKMKFPPGISGADKQAYMDNIRTWLTIANTFTNFPGDYNGGDPLGTRSVSQVKTMGDKLIQAMTGDPAQQAEAMAWLTSADNKVYCAELAHVALNLGISYPLNKSNLGARFDAVKTALESKEFLAKNGNQHAKLVDLTLAPESLKPMQEKLGVTATEPTAAQPFGDGLATRPFTMPNLIEEFVASMATRDLGRTLTPDEAKGLAAAQTELFKGSRPGIVEAAGLNQMPSTDPRRVGIEALLDGIQGVLAQPFTEYAQFRAAIDPLLAKAGEVAGPRPNGAGAFFPPHGWLLHALNKAETKGGLIGMEIVGHGLHASHLNEKPAP
ncbi:MAG: hypothetical protein JNK82_02680 [Myxococcaceae bacterium]|nr:hypothetical protein [Myxococcaceae bacterium]